MYQFFYVEVMEDGVVDVKECECQVFDCLIEFMSVVVECGCNFNEVVEVIYYICMFWVRFMEDLCLLDNQFELELKVNFILIVIWIFNEIEKICKCEFDNFQGIVEIIIIIRDGLK